MKNSILASMAIISLLTVASAQAESGDKGRMRLSEEDKGTATHHTLRGSQVHEAAASAHSLAAKHHSIAAAMYRKNADSNAVEHAEKAITFSDDAAKATKATKAILPKK